MSPERLARVRLLKEWARHALALQEDTLIMATELRCTEPGCPPFETVIAVMGKGAKRQQFKIHKEIGDVLREDVEDGAARMLRGEPHKHALSMEREAMVVTEPTRPHRGDDGK